VNRHFREISVAAAFALLLVVLAVFRPHFFELQPLLSRVTSQSPALVTAIGMTMVMICRQIDISVGSQFGLCAVIAGRLAESGVPLPLVFLASIGAGAAMGAINGGLVAWMRLPSIVVTLATMVIWQEGLRLWQVGRMINLPAGFQWFGLSQRSGQFAIIIFTVALVFAAAWGMRHLTAGRYVYAVGSDAEAARLAGIEPRRVTFGVFVMMGALTGLAAILNMAQSPQVEPKSGEGLEMRVIAACVVGGVAVNGGRGSLWGVFFGLLLLVNVNPALTHFHVNAYWEKAIQGAVILLAVVADGLRSRGKQKLSAA
jgi:rhamnose transport system permease protein